MTTAIAVCERKKRIIISRVKMALTKRKEYLTCYKMPDKNNLRTLIGEEDCFITKLYNMLSQKLKPGTIEEYIATTPLKVQEKLYQLHACILKAAPNATESLKWGMPAYSLQKILVTFKAFKHYIGFYPMPSALKAFADDLTNYTTVKASIQLPLDQPLPLPLIRKIVQFRVKESVEGTIKWRS